MASKVTLGKGLAALFPDMANDMADRPSFIMCGIEEIIPNRYQPRKEFPAAEQKQLVDSIKKKGIIQPIVLEQILHDPIIRETEIPITTDNNMVDDMNIQQLACFYDLFG